MKPISLTVALLAATSSILPAVTLVEVDFSGTGGSAVGTIPASNAQFTVKNAAVNFSSTSLITVGGGSGVGGWTIDGTGTAAANTDLHTASNFGSPTRFDLNPGLATVGASYTITGVEVDIRASGTAVSWEFGYRRTSDNATVLVGLQTIAIQSGAVPVATYFIDLSGENLTATDSAATWVLSGTGALRWEFFQAVGNNNDNFQVDAVRLIGTAIPEPSLPLMLGSMALLGLCKRRR